MCTRRPKFQPCVLLISVTQMDEPSVTVISTGAPERFTHYPEVSKWWSQNLTDSLARDLEPNPGTLGTFYSL